MAETLNDQYLELFGKVMEDDLHSQTYYLSVIEDQRHIPVDYLLEQGVLFIPNNDYIVHYLGTRVQQSATGLYYHERCLWTLFVVLPVRDLSGKIVGLTGWDAYNKYKEITEGEEGLVSYKVSAKGIFPKEKYFLTDIFCLERNFEYRVIFVTDGVFDSVALNYRNIPAIALLGSTFSKEVLYFLSWYRHIYVCSDNDRAGLILHAKLSKALPGVHRIIQGKAKDIEELLRSDGDVGPITKQLQNLVRHPIGYDVTLKTG